MTQSPGMIVRAVNPDGTNIGSGAGGSVTISSGTVTATPFNASSVTGSGVVAGPAAGAAIATVAAPPAGTYDIQVWVSVTGTSTAAADANNMSVSVGGSKIVTNTPYNCGTSGSITNGGPFYFQQILTGAQNITVNAVAAATATASYSAVISAVRIL